MNQRIEQLDVLRGISVLGILLMNIKGFALIGALYINPLAAGPLSTPEWLLFVTERLFVDYKFLALFSLLFGAGIALLDAKFQQTGAKAFFHQSSRLLALALIGAIHAFLLWYGDILLSYAMCGLVALLFVRVPIKALIPLAVAFACVPLWYFISNQLSIQNASADAVQSMVSSFWVPSETAATSEISKYTGSWGEQFEARLSSLQFMLLYLFPRENFWKSTSLMLFGIVLYKSGFFTGQWQAKRYLQMGLILTCTGLLITGAGMVNDIQHQFDIRVALNQGRMLLYIGSIPQGIGYAALFYWLTATQIPFLLSKLGAVGRMALTNYLSQTVICTFLFYGWGLGLFGEFGVLTLVLFAFAIWALQIFLSNWWLQSHQQGPLEWLWRRMTFFRKVH